MKPTTITGKTKLFCIIADPIEHVRTPQFFNDYLRAIGEDAVLVPTHVRPAALGTLIEGLRKIVNLQAIIVTVPHKITSLAYCDELDETARLVGAVNVIKRDRRGRLIGGNFDGSGFADALESATGPVEGRAIYLAGAGGVARAIAFNLAMRGIARLAVYNRSTDKSAALRDEILANFPDIAVELADRSPSDVDIAINATSLGLHAGDAMPFTLDHLSRSATVAEVIMQPAVTPLLRLAKERGHPVVGGEAMLTHQLASWIAFIRDERPVEPDARIAAAGE